MSERILEYLLGNALLAATLAVLLLAVSRRVRSPELRHGLWVLVLLQLIAPPVLRLPVLCLPGISSSDREPASMPGAAVASSAAVPGTLALDDEALERLRLEALAALDALGRGESFILEEAEAGGSSPESALLVPGVSSPGAARSGPLPAGSPASRPEEDKGPSARASGTQGQTVASTAAWFAGLYLAVSGLILLLLLMRVRRFQRELQGAEEAPRELRRRAQQIGRELGVRRLPRLQLLPGSLPPLLWSPLLGRSRILIPRALLERCSDAALDALLAHELAHFARGDQHVRRLEVIVQLLFWWFPLLPLVRRRLREAEELACDRRALSVLPVRRGYAQALVDVAAFVGREHDSILPLTSGAAPVHDLERRLRMIYQNENRRRPRAARLLLLSLGAISLPFAPGFAQERVHEVRVGSPFVAPPTVDVIQEGVEIVEGKPLPKLQERRREKELRVEKELREKRRALRSAAEQQLEHLSIQLEAMLKQRSALERDIRLIRELAEEKKQAFAKQLRLTNRRDALLEDQEAKQLEERLARLRVEFPQILTEESATFAATAKRLSQEAQRMAKAAKALEQKGQMSAAAALSKASKVLDEQAAALEKTQLFRFTTSLGRSKPVAIPTPPVLDKGAAPRAPKRPSARRSAGSEAPKSGSSKDQELKMLRQLLGDMARRLERLEKAQAAGAGSPSGR
jgi:beta-lactamase regulating signal transducer with metallopeptidase domain